MIIVDLTMWNFGRLRLSFAVKPAIEQILNCHEVRMCSSGPWAEGLHWVDCSLSQRKTTKQQKCYQADIVQFKERIS